LVFSQQVIPQSSGYPQQCYSPIVGVLPAWVFFLKQIWVCLISPCRVYPLSRKCQSFPAISPLRYILVDDGCFRSLPNGMGFPYLSSFLIRMSLDSVCLFGSILNWLLVDYLLCRPGA
jgi:hypothetical protein